MSIQNFLVEESLNERNGPLYKAIPFEYRVSLIDSDVSNLALLSLNSTILVSFVSTNEFNSFTFLTIKSYLQTNSS